MVVTLAPSQVAASTVQDLMARPSTCTTQAPHWLVSQPTCVPVSRRFSRTNCTSSVRGSTSALTALPLTVIDTCDGAGPCGPAACRRCLGRLPSCGKTCVASCLPAEQMRRGRFVIVLVLDYATDVAWAQSNRRFRRGRGTRPVMDRAGLRVLGEHARTPWCQAHGRSVRHDQSEHDHHPRRPTCRCTTQ